MLTVVTRAIAIDIAIGLDASYTRVSKNDSRIHGPCLWAVNTGVVLETREHGPSRSVRAIVNDVVFFLLAGRLQ